MNNHFSACRLGTLFVFLAGGIAAQERPVISGPDALKNLSLEQLSQVEITSVTKEAVPAFQAPVAISVLTSDDIRNSGLQTIPDLLRLIPGVNVAQIAGSDFAIGIRGFQNKLSKSTLVLIDGRSVYTPLFAGVYWDMQDVMIQDIDRIEVIRGPGGTIWGSNAVNGVINIITKSAHDTRGMLVSAGGGTLEQGFLNWRYGGGTDTLSYRVYGKGFSRAPQYHADDQNFDDWRRGQMGFRADWNAGSRDAVTIQGDFFGGEAGQALRVSTFDPPTNRALQADKLFNGQNVMAAWRRALRSGSDLQIRSYYDRTDRQELNFKEVRHTFDVDFIHHIPKSRHDFTWGLGARTSPSQFFQTVETVDFRPHNQTYNIFSAFVQDEIALRPNRLFLTIGTKLEYTTYSGFNYQPSARISWVPNRQNTFWAAVSRAVRTASRIEDDFNYNALTRLNPVTYVRLRGDGVFTQEQMLGYEVGYRRYLTAKGFVTVALFHNRYDDLLSTELAAPLVESGPPQRRIDPLLLLRNGMRANISGGEITGLADLKTWLRFRASYSLAMVGASYRPGSLDRGTEPQLEGDTSRHKVVVRSSISLPKNFETDLTFRYVSAVRGPQTAAPAYATGDVRFGRKLGDRLRIDVVGQNLLQPSHAEYAGVPGPRVGIRRSGFLRLTWTP